MIKSLQSLRFYIILLIFVTHLFFIQNIPVLSNIYSKYFSNGAIGVTFFFILSGFVIRLGYGEKFKKITLKNYFNFIKKRIIKIYPIYIISIIIMFVFLQYLSSFEISHLISNIKKLVLCIPLIQTLIPIQDINQSFNGAAWFLSSLFIIYLCTPFLLHLNYKNKDSLKSNIIKMFIIYVIYIILLFIILKFVGDKYKISLMYCSPFLRIFQYYLGILLANIYLLFKDKHKSNNSLLEIVSIILFLILFIFTPTISKKIGSILNIDYLSTMISYSIYIFISLFTIYIFSFDKGIISKFLSNSINLYLGNISFYIYIIHLPLIEITYHFLVKYKLFITPIYYFLPIVYLISTIGLSILYKYIYSKIVK